MSAEHGIIKTNRRRPVGRTAVLLTAVAATLFLLTVLARL